ncbi:MAG: 50S ribosomal protein L29 [Phycisphaerales bacterium]|nr:50S ribosomal protein L29 [Phycisphaerales bacterium]
MKGDDIRKLNDEEIGVELARLRGETLARRTKAVSEKIENTSQTTNIRRHIARLLTEQTVRRKATVAR